PNHLTIAGGDLTLTNAAVALTLTNGRATTGNNILYLNSPTATVTRTNGSVAGNLRKNFAAVGSKTFEVGTGSGYSPVAFNVTAATFPVDITAKATGTASPGLPPDVSLKRYWTLTVPAAGAVTADLTFNYLAVDVPATANESFFKVLRHDGAGYTDVG